MLARMEQLATIVGAPAGEFTECKYPGEPRWRIDARWVEFECSCRAERARVLHGQQPYDPVIFAGLPEQAVYDSVCHWHAPAMNKRCHFGGFADFAQWRRDRRARLMGK